MNKLPIEKRTQILSMLCEGSSMRSISRVTGVSINTVSKLLADAGTVCAQFHDDMVRDVEAEKVQCDEIWSFCYAKAKNVKTAKEAPMRAGDVWTWTAIDADSKMIVGWYVGDRHAGSAHLFMKDIASRLSNRVQLTTDGYKPYLKAVRDNFGDEIDYAQLVKLYGSVPGRGAAGKYSLGVCIGANKSPVTGDPDERNISTSYVEWANLTMRMSMRRFTRLTNAFSKRIENHYHALALYFVWYNFIRIHKTLKVSPAMAAGITGSLLEWSDVIEMIDAANPSKKRGPYKKRAEISN